LQRHRQVISFILVNIDGKAITFDQMSNILVTIDNRLQEEVP
jgi:hypothetical protein